MKGIVSQICENSLKFPFTITKEFAFDEEETSGCYGNK